MEHHSSPPSLANTWQQRRVIFHCASRDVLYYFVLTRGNRDVWYFIVPPPDVLYYFVTQGNRDVLHCIVPPSDVLYYVVNQGNRDVWFFSVPPPDVLYYVVTQGNTDVLYFIVPPPGVLYYFVLINTWQQRRVTLHCASFWRALTQTCYIALCLLLTCSNTDVLHCTVPPENTDELNCNATLSNGNVSYYVVWLEIQTYYAVTWQ